MSLQTGIFWDMENVRPLSDTCIYTLSLNLRDMISKNGGYILEKKIYYDSQSPSEIKTNRSDFDMAGWSLIDCPKRQKKETLDKKIIVDIMCFIASHKANETCVCLISGDGDFSYIMNRIRDLGVFTILLYPEKITFAPLIKTTNLSFSWENDILEKVSLEIFKELNENNKIDMTESIEKRKRTLSLESIETKRPNTSVIIKNKIPEVIKNNKNNNSNTNSNLTEIKFQINYETERNIKDISSEIDKSDNKPNIKSDNKPNNKSDNKPNNKSDNKADNKSDDKLDDKPDDNNYALMLLLQCLIKASEKNKNMEQCVLDALVADLWYRSIKKKTEGTIGPTTKEWYKNVRKHAIDKKYIELIERKDVPGHIIKYLKITEIGIEYSIY